MATEVVKTVGPSGDYASLSAFEAGEARDLVTADEIAVAEVQGFTDTTAVDWGATAGWTTDATRYIEVRPASGAEAQVPWATSGAYILSATAGTGGVMGNSGGLNVRLRRIQIENTSGSATSFILGNSENPGGRSQWDELFGLYLRFSSTSNNSRFAARLNGSSAPLRNCFIELDGNQDTCEGNNTPMAQNTTVVILDGDSTAVGLGEDFSAPTTENCLVVDLGGGGATCFGSTVGGDFNASSDATAPGANSLTSISDPFVDSSGGDYHLDSGSAPVDEGTDLSGSFTTDFDGDTRDASWDIGADELVAGGTTFTGGGGTGRIIFS